MQKLEAEVIYPVGLHARPAARFVKVAKGFSSEIRVRNLTRDGEFVNAKSLARVVKIAVAQHQKVSITAEGEDEDAAIRALEEFLSNTAENQQ